MANPWMKKNPLMSMWLSAANQSLGTARAATQAAARRQVTTAQNDAVRQIMDFWGASAGLTKPRKSRRR